MWGGWGERKRERAGHDRKGKERRDFCLVPFPIFPRALSIFPIIANFIEIPSWSLCGGESHHPVETVWMARNVFCSGYLESCNQEELFLLIPLQFPSTLQKESRCCTYLWISNWTLHTLLILSGIILKLVPLWR